MGNDGRLGGRPRLGVVQVVCPACGKLRDDGSLISWKGGEMCVRCSVEMLEEELHGAPADFRREARAMNDARRFANARESADFRGENVVRGSSEADG